MNFTERTVSSKEIFKGKIIEVKVDTVELPNGLGQQTRELVFHPGGISVLAITDEDKVILERQFRKPLEKMIYEVPAGKLEEGEYSNLENAVLRELEEETDYHASHLKKIHEFYVSPGISNEVNILFEARGLTKVQNAKPADIGELIEVIEMTFDEVQKLIAQGEIQDAKTLIALQYWELIRLRSK
ncbi:NUDIX hydrolase [Lactovum miscens]|uniref:ADP-ribose pyrophosphatase n=1 Tax=Lactovum miscens TaxID=190387 RepID=A0A841CAF4_9LACT|nr:NUDIX hydrolase [Lactovum miscens]MBB5888541.1 ADP-ribose pyrophosphatase [Lactovum miscens]